MKSLLCAILLVCGTAAADAQTAGWKGQQTASAEIVPAAFGTTGRTMLTIASPAFVPSTGSAASWSVNGGDAYLTTPSLTPFYASVDIPVGSIVERLELLGCDASATGQLAFALWAPWHDGTDDGTALLTTGVPDIPGCQLFGSEVAPFEISQNQTLIAFVTGSDAANTRFRAFRIFYRRQVSPAPAVATFADVPTSHGFFKFVEALAAAGITAGCGGGNYCPDSPVTRGQMAVFLASALGLHWPN